MVSLLIYKPLFLLIFSKSHETYMLCRDMKSSYCWQNWNSVTDNFMLPTCICFYSMHLNYITFKFVLWCLSLLSKLHYISTELNAYPFHLPKFNPWKLSFSKWQEIKCSMNSLMAQYPRKYTLQSHPSESGEKPNFYIINLRFSCFYRMRGDSDYFFKLWRQLDPIFSHFRS